RPAPNASGESRAGHTRRVMFQVAGASLSAYRPTAAYGNWQEGDGREDGCAAMAPCWLQRPALKEEPKMAIHSVGDRSRREILKMSAALGGSGVFLSTGLAGAAQPAGQLTWGVHTSLAPTWFDPAETPGTVVPFMVMYALHDA